MPILSGACLKEKKARRVCQKLKLQKLRGIESERFRIQDSGYRVQGSPFTIHYSLLTIHYSPSRYPSSSIISCPNLSLFASRYFLLCGLDEISIGIFSTISRP